MSASSFAVGRNGVAPREGATPAEAEPVPTRANGVELIGELAGSGYRQSPALVRRADGQTVQLTPLLYHLLQAIDGQRDYDALAAALGERIGRHVTCADVRFLSEKKLRPLGLLQRPDGAAPVVARPNPLLILRPKLVVSNPETTRRLTAPFTGLFRPWVALPVVVAFGAVTWWIVFEKGLASAAHDALYRPTLILLVLALTLLSAGFHEIGHAAACRYGGGRPGRMGIGLYLVWPAFYTDVTDSYRLSRKGRLRVDIGGLYFNAVFAVATAVVWLLIRWDPLLLVVAAQPLMMARQLIPFARFDGYHVLADLVGVPDLFRHIKPTLLSVLQLRRRRPDAQALKAWARAVVTLWVLVAVPVLLALVIFMVVALPRVIGTASDSFRLQLSALEAGWGHADAPTVAARLFSMLMIVLPSSGIVYMLLRLSRRAVKSVLRATTGRPLLRAAAGLASAALVACLVWAWWPGGDNYQPIGAVGAFPMPPLRASAAPKPPAVEPTPRLVQAALYRPVDTHAAPPERVAPRSAQSAGPPARRKTAPGGGGGAVGPPDQGAGAASGWIFPFPPPPPPGPNDNQALAVNTTDGSSTSILALSPVWVTNGDKVDERNTAFAAASCTNCQAVAVAFQVVFVVGYSGVVTPVNDAVAVNYHCVTCTARAVAVQLVVTLTRRPSDSALLEISNVWAQLEQERSGLSHRPVEEVYADLKSARTQLVDILARDGDLASDAAVTTSTKDASTTGDGTSTSTTPTTTTTPTTSTPTTTDTTTTTPTTTDTTPPTTTTSTTTTPTTTDATTTPTTTDATTTTTP